MRRHPAAAAAATPSSGGGGAAAAPAAAAALPVYTADGLRVAGPQDAKPRYDDSDLLSSTLMALFRRKMVEEIGSDTGEPAGYDGIVSLSRRLNAKCVG